ncbi:MAG: helix-turn-helix transcriptional regulator [Kiritimatiellaeota bacterium]|nr:helix-turn-helix transcriptional regulator [Kiritimatiellota bacterium]
MRRVGVEDVEPLVRQANYFKLSGGERSWGPRSISDYELIHIAAGDFAYDNLETGESFSVPEGATLCIPPAERHLFRMVAERPYGSIIACVHFELLGNGTRVNGDYIPEPEPPLITLTDGSVPIHQLFRNCRDVFERYGPRRDALLSVMLKEIWLRLSEFWSGEPHSIVAKRTEAMLGFIRENAPRVVSRRELGGRFGLTPEHVNAIFKKELGMTPTEVSHRIRVNLACGYIQEDGLSLQQTAEKCGFRDEYHFSRVFKKVMGIPPGKFAGR